MRYNKTYHQGRVAQALCVLGLWYAGWISWNNIEHMKSFALKYKAKGVVSHDRTLLEYSGEGEFY